jgi:hypothetical protein
MGDEGAEDLFVLVAEVGRGNTKLFSAPLIFAVAMFPLIRSARMGEKLVSRNQ